MVTQFIRKKRKYVRFIREGKIYQFLAMLNGYTDAIQIFNKLVKPVFVYLYKLCYESSVYIDNTLLLAQTFEECFDYVLTTISLSQELGFVIQPTKSICTNTKSF